MVLGFAGIFGGNARTAAVAATAKSSPAKQLQTKAATGFGPALKAAVQSEVKAATRVSPIAVATSQRRVISAKVTSLRDSYTPSSALTLLTGLPPLTVPASTVPAVPTTTSTPVAAGTKSAATPTAAATDGVADGNATVLDALKAGLVQAGVDISGMQFTRHQDLVTYPGGSYVNDLISFSANSGQTHEYMTNLVGIAPKVTVAEIQQLMAGNRG